jgi:hypothetical protein
MVVLVLKVSSIVTDMLEFIGSINSSFLFPQYFTKAMFGDASAVTRSDVPTPPSDSHISHKTSI